MSDRPNILWICTDQQRADTLGCTGNPWVHSPNLDRLGAEGRVFSRAFSQSPVCTPSRAAFLTGRYPRTCRGRQNGADLPDHEVLVTRVLADAGYRCGLAGKLHLRACNPDAIGQNAVEQRLDDGYSDFHWSHHSGSMQPAKNDYWRWLRARALDYHRKPIHESPCVACAMTPETSQTAWCADTACHFIEAHADDPKPWLFSVNVFDPHHAFDAPREMLMPYLDRLDDIPLPDYLEGELRDKPHWQTYDHENGGYGLDRRFIWRDMSARDHRLVRASYWAMCDLIDRYVGTLLHALETTGQRERTMVIFTSDHGEMLGDHGIYLKGPFLYDCAINVPLIIAWPGVIEPGRSDALVELLDLPQTILDAASLPHHPGMQGKSLWPMLQGRRTTASHRDDVYCEYYNACNGHNGDGRPAMLTMVRTKTHKLVVAHGEHTGELYDLENDPREWHNLWNDPAAINLKNELLLRLSDRMAFAVDPLPERRAPW